MTSRARRNLAVGLGVTVLGVVMGTVPYWVRSKAEKNLTESESGLTGSQIMRGPYINTGSKDVGRDDTSRRVARGEWR